MPSQLGCGDSPEQREILREDAVRIRFSRDLRRESFDANLFGEPAWDILLTLYVSEHTQRRLSTRAIAKLANCPLTTALRWLDYLEEQGLICRLSNPVDQRVVHIALSKKGVAAMDNYLVQLRNAGMFRSTSPSRTIS